MQMAVAYRRLLPADDLELITDLLHEAYAPLAAAGLRFVASYQETAITKKQLENSSGVNYRSVILSKRL